MKKLLFVTSAIGYGIGGSEKALIEMLKKLDLTKYSITVLSLKEKRRKNSKEMELVSYMGNLHFYVCMSHLLLHYEIYITINSEN